MSKFFNYYNSLCVGANSPIVFSFDPYIVAVKQMFIDELRQIVFYIQKLKELNVNISDYRDKVIEFVSLLLVNYDFNKDSFFIILDDLYQNKDKLHSLYVSTCTELNLDIEVLNFETPILDNKNDILKVLNSYEQDNSIHNLQLSTNKKNLYNIIVNLILNACNVLIELKNYGINYSEAKDEVLNFFNLSNFINSEENFLIKKIEEFSKFNFLIMSELSNAILHKFGPISQVVVNNQKIVGHSILVSGFSYLELYRLLELTKDLNINVYTHDNMISAFKYSKFKQYKNFVGHYQPSENNFSYDFSSFAGPVYISKNYLPKFDCISGQIYTSSKYPSKGVAKVLNNDFSAFIENALSSSGFQETEVYSSLIVGADEPVLIEKINEIIMKFKSKEITHIVIVGLVDDNNFLINYMSEFFKTLPNDYFVISFALNSDREKFLNINQYFDYTTMYFLIDLLSKDIKRMDKYVSVFLPDCSSNILSHIFNFKYLGIKNIFLGPCCPSIINPSLFKTLNDLFSVREISTPKKDIKYLK